MRLHLFSDLHLEFGPLELPESVISGQLAELVLLAGDIDVKRRSVKWAAATFSQPVAIIGGNHEGYRDSLFAMIAESRKQAEAATRDRKEPIRYLERERWDLTMRDGMSIRILGATLWTDFELFGRDNRGKAMVHAYENMNDYSVIHLRENQVKEKQRLLPTDTSFIHRETRYFFERELGIPFDGVTIVMTHHAPSILSLPQEDRTDLHAACYASALEALIEQYQPQLWVHGHIHVANDYRVGSTRIVSNPRGYAPGRLNPLFNPTLVIEI